MSIRISYELDNRQRCMPRACSSLPLSLSLTLIVARQKPRRVFKDDATRIRGKEEAERSRAPYRAKMWLFLCNIEGNGQAADTRDQSRTSNPSESACASARRARLGFGRIISSSQYQRDVLKCRPAANQLAEPLRTRRTPTCSTEKNVPEAAPDW